ncbi:GAK5 protein, partial [Peucedramus taeniatus]|nr:GAK5 protein [Peucedramus taeniatus]
GSPKTSGVCFYCNKPSHLKRDCPALKGNKSETDPLCQRCHGGPHSANQCRSKYDSEGRLLQGFQGNKRQSGGQQCRAPTQIPQLPSQITAPQMPALQKPTGGSPQVFT